MEEMSDQAGVHVIAGVQRIRHEKANGRSDIEDKLAVQNTEGNRPLASRLAQEFNEQTGGLALAFGLEFRGTAELDLSRDADMLPGSRSGGLRVGLPMACDVLRC
jgi:hypothetical protein